MAVALIVLVPLAAGIAVLGQYIHIKQQAQAAARQAAWAATVDHSLSGKGLPDRDTLQTRLRARIFGDPAAAIRSDDQAPDAFADTMLTTFAGSELVKPDDLQLTVYQQEAAPSYLDQGINMVGKVAGALGTLPPNDQGLVTAQVSAKTQPLVDRDGEPLAFLDPLDTLRPSFSARTVLLADAWDAAGSGETAKGDAISGASPRAVRNVIRPLVPSSWLGNQSDKMINGVVNVLGKIPIVDQVFTPGLDEFRLGRTAPDVVPTDKLVKYEDVR
jgi:hypothetical protein